MSAPIAFIDLAAQAARLGTRCEEAVVRVCRHGQYINGPEVAALEGQLAAFCGAREAIGCASGTDALVLALMAAGIGPGDAVFVPAFTFVATAEAPALLGAAPVFVDVLPDTFTMDPASLERAIAGARDAGLRPRAVIPVDLFGLPADYPALLAIAQAADLFVLSDAAQSFGGAIGERRVGTFGHATATSFFPAKPLGCYGDGGAVFTDDANLAATMRSIRVHGQGEHKYDNVRVGLNARLDTMQAAILIEKLAIFADELEARDRVAARYRALLPAAVTCQPVAAGSRSAWAQFTILVDDRDRLQRVCKDAGVPTAIYYPVPLHRQPGYAAYTTAPGGCPVSEDLSGRVASLPMHPYLSEADQDRVVAAVRAAVQAGADVS